MVPWTAIAGALACAAFPQHRGAIFVAGAVLGILRGEGEEQKPSDADLGGKVKKVTLEWRDVHCLLLDKKGKNDRELLGGIGGTAAPGRLLAIMGPSGSGKTTLLNALAGQLPRSGRTRLSGEITVNGVPRRDSRHRQAYIKQEDVFFSQLTVRETLLMAAKLQLPAKLPESEKEAYVDSLLQRLGLVAAADTIVGDAKARGISGGEKKRLSIACELIASPSVIFADEPTTGLDAFQAERVMQTLQQLAHEGHAVICSIHQPRGSIWAMFDDLLLLAEGRAVYSGPREDALAYFADLGHSCPVHSNPAEFFSDLISVDYSSPESESETRARVGELAAAFAGRRRREAPAAPEANGEDAGDEEAGRDIAKGALAEGPRGGWATQFRLLLQRAWRQTARDRATNLVRGTMNVTSGLIFGSIFWRMGFGQTSIQDRMGLLQVAAINTAMASLTKTVNVFPRERTIVDRERAKGSYGTGPYFASKLLAELPVGALFPLAFGSIVYPMAGLHKSLVRFARFLGIITLESFASSAMGLAVGSVVPTTEAALALGPSVMTVFIVFGGYYVNARNTPALFRWIPNVSLIRWAFEALSLNEFRGLVFETRGPVDAATGEQVLDRLSFADSSLDRCVRKEAQILIFFYWSTYSLLKAKRPAFEPLLAPSTDGQDGPRAAPADPAAEAAEKPDSSVAPEAGKGSQDVPRAIVAV